MAIFICLNWSEHIKANSGNIGSLDSITIYFFFAFFLQRITQLASSCLSEYIQHVWEQKGQRKSTQYMKCNKSVDTSSALFKGHFYVIRAFGYAKNNALEPWLPEQSMFYSYK